MSETPILSVRGVDAWYGHAHVVQGVSLELGAESVAVMGRNGAGKTTLVRAIMGLTPPRATGEIVLHGKDLSKAPPHGRAKAGLGYVPQGRRVFGSVTVAEHLAVVRRRGDQHWTEERIYEMFPTLAERRRVAAGNLSGGQKSMLAVARALMTNPACLILDEPTEGLAPSIVDELCRLVRDMARAGTPVLMVEQNIHAAELAADRVVFLSAGRVAATCTAEEFRSDHSLRDLYLGVTPIEV